MKNTIKIIGILLIFLTACTDKKAQKSNENDTSAVQIEELQQIETLTNEMEESTQNIEAKAQELDALLKEIDN